MDLFSEINRKCLNATIKILAENVSTIKHGIVIQRYFIIAESEKATEQATDCLK